MGTNSGATVTCREEAKKERERLCFASFCFHSLWRPSLFPPSLLRPAWPRPMTASLPWRVCGGSHAPWLRHVKDALRSFSPSFPFASALSIGRETRDEKIRREEHCKKVKQNWQLRTRTPSPDSQTHRLDIWNKDRQEASEMRDCTLCTPSISG